MHLSSFELNLDHKDARRDLGNPYEMHRTLARLVDGGHALWRQEGERVLLLSESEPQWAVLSSDYFATPPGSKPFPLDNLKLAQRRLRFRLQANPTKSIKEGIQRPNRGKRVQLIKDQDLLHWLSRQGERCGFEVLDATPSQVRDLRFRKQRGQTEVVLGSCTFDGILAVKDDKLFRAALRQGLGRAKAFGLGLLSIAPV